MTAQKINLEQIRSALSEAGDPWEPGVTSLSSLSFEEQIKRLGVRPPPGEPTIEEIEQRVEAQIESLKAEALTAVGAPAAYDLRNIDGNNFVTPITDQKSCGSCVAFGVVATVESKLRVQRGNPNLAVDLSEGHLFSCLGPNNCPGGGWWPTNAYDALQKTGVVDEACYPYDLCLKNSKCVGLCSDWANRITKISGYTDLTGKPADIKNWVSTNGPVSACFIVYQDFFSYKSGIYKHVSGDQAGGHCVTIVGYNDNPGYWICKNSWNTTWGDKGFFNIAYGECGIDSWGNHGVNAIDNTGWQTNCHVKIGRAHV
jgi:C1A family cysteine protease